MGKSVLPTSTKGRDNVSRDGSIELTFPVASYAEIMMEILKHGSDVEVIKPKSLRELIKSEAKKSQKSTKKLTSKT